MTTFSVLDLAPIVQGSDAATSFRNSMELARHAETLGFHRFWLAEHHGMPGIASAATSVLIGHIAGGTSTIRVGAGGIMLPNHSPLIIAEQFGTLESLYPGRIDLGLGRAPGSDQVVARALRRHLDTDPEAFPQDVLELMEYFSEDSRLPVTAVPGKGLSPEFWILGSSLFGAQLAAYLGLPYSFASHFAPQMMMQAIQVYRNNFRPSKHLAEPYVMLGYNVLPQIQTRKHITWRRRGSNLSSACETAGLSNYRHPSPDTQTRWHRMSERCSTPFYLALPLVRPTPSRTLSVNSSNVQKRTS